MTIDLNLETILAIAITFLALNLIFIGFYITSVLREIKKTVSKAGKVIDDVDKSVNDGIGKAAALEKPLQALATTSVALSSVIKATSFGRKTTSSILPSQPTYPPEQYSQPQPVTQQTPQNYNQANSVQSQPLPTNDSEPIQNPVSDEVEIMEPNMNANLENMVLGSQQQSIKKKSRRPKLFRSSKATLN